MRTAEEAERNAAAETDEVSGKDEDAEDEEDEEEGEEEEDLSEEYEALLESLKEMKEQNNGRLEDQQVIAFFREKLHSKPCQNQGFILDGYPKTMDQAKELFAGMNSSCCLYCVSKTIWDHFAF